jgi:hypothetical protein
MADFPWLPVGFEIGGGIATGRLLDHGVAYQIVAERSGDGSILLLDPSALPPSPALARLLKRAQDTVFGGRRIKAVAFDEDSKPVRVGTIERRVESMTSSDLTALMSGLRRMSNESPQASWEQAIFLVSDADCVPASLTSDIGRHRELAVRIMTGGVAEQRLSARQVKARALWLTIDEIEEFLNFADGHSPEMARESYPEAVPDAPFHLAGQPDFSRLINEYVVDQQRHLERYKAMGVKMPNGILLYGPRGSGKTFALRKLAAFLSWHVIEVTLGAVGSPYIHQTSSRFRKVFSDAETSRPTLLVMNEIDALASGRSDRSDDHKVEEVNELLGLVENAAERGILVAGTTNRREAIDNAFLRKGRFDLQIEIKYPDEQQALELLRALLGDRPHVPGINLEPLARQFAGRPASDIDWAVNEAARVAVKAGKDAIDDICLFSASGRLKKDQQT